MFLILDFWVKKIRGEWLFFLVMEGNWWFRNVYSFGINFLEINEGVIVGGGGIRGGIKNNLKGI